MKAKICREAGCNTLVENNLVYCSKHTKPKREPFNYSGLSRTNENLYNTTVWRKLRKEKLTEQPYCSKCGINSNLHVHHKVAPRGNELMFFDVNNLDVLCAQCHRLETLREMRGRRK